MGGESEKRPNPAVPSVVSDPVITTPTAPRGRRLFGGRRPDAPDVDAATGTASDTFELLFHDHYDRLVRALTVVSGDRESAADAVQEAFVKAHLRWRRVGTYDDPVGWIRRVAINRLRDDHRRSGRKQRAVDRLAARPPEHTTTAEPDELGTLLASLPRQQRAATALFYVDELSVAEIARALGLSEGTVKSHLHDARRRLRAVLDTPGSDPTGARP